MSQNDIRLSAVFEEMARELSSPVNDRKRDYARERQR